MVAVAVTAAALALWAGGRRGRLLLPARFERLALEHRAAELDHETWVVDRGLVPWAERALAGQISLVRPTPLAGTPPDPALMEQHLRQELEQLAPTLAAALRLKLRSSACGGWVSGAEQHS